MRPTRRPPREPNAGSELWLQHLSALISPVLRKSYPHLGDQELLLPALLLREEAVHVEIKVRGLEFGGRGHAEITRSSGFNPQHCT